MVFSALRTKINKTLKACKFVLVLSKWRFLPCMTIYFLNKFSYTAFAHFRLAFWGNNKLRSSQWSWRNLIWIPFVLVLTDIYVLDRVRGKRDHYASVYRLCSPGELRNLDRCLAKFGHLVVKAFLSCKWDGLRCFYIATCQHRASSVNSNNYDCMKVYHIYYYGYCCTIPFARFNCWLNSCNPGQYV